MQKDILIYKQDSSTVHRLFLGTDKTTVIFRRSVALEMLVATTTVTSIIMLTHSRTSVVTQEVVLLVVTRAEELKRAWVRVVADGLQDHVVTLSKGAVPDIFHSLDEGKRSSVSSLGLLLEMHGQS